MFRYHYADILEFQQAQYIKAYQILCVSHWCIVNYIIVLFTDPRAAPTGGCVSH